MHTIVNNQICSKCGSPAKHHYKIENRGYGSKFDSLDGYEPEFYLCEDCNEDTLFYMVNESPIIIDGIETYLMENLLMMFIETFPYESQQSVLNGKEYIELAKAYEEVGSFDTSNCAYYYNEAAEKELEEAYSQMSEEDWSELYED